MITRGIIIGNIIDNLATLQGQVNLRGRVHLYDLNTFCEDFFRDVLNLSYNLTLKNLNERHLNVPGIDLGDMDRCIAFQITSVKTSEKINNMLRVLTDDQLAKYKSVNVFIIGDKQNTYDAIEDDLKTKCNFKVEDNIIDIADLTKVIVSLPYETLYKLHLIFEKQFQKVIIEFQIPDKEGKYPNSLLDKLEVAPDTVCKNSAKFFTSYPDYDLPTIIEVFNKLAKLPRVTREFLNALVKVAEQDDENYKISLAKFKRLLPISDIELREEISILSEARIIFEPDEEDPSLKTRFDGTLFDLTEYAIENNCLTKILSALDFTVLDA